MCMDVQPACIDASGTCRGLKTSSDSPGTGVTAVGHHGGAGIRT